MTTFKAGDRVKITSNKQGKGNSGCPSGAGTIIQWNSSYWLLKHDNGTNYNAYPHEIESLNLTKKDLEKDISELEKQIEEVRSKLNYMNELGTDTYNADEHRIFDALTILDSESTSQLKKVKLLAELLNK